MRTMRGYCRRQARREVHKAFRNVDWNKPATKSEVSDQDVLIAIGGLFGIIYFIGLFIG